MAGDLRQRIYKHDWRVFLVTDSMVDVWRSARSASGTSWAETADELELPSRETCLQLLAGIRFAEVDVVAILNQGVDLEEFASRIASRRELGDLPVACPKGHELGVVVKNGRGGRGEQRYHCRRCRSSFSVLTDTIFYRHQLPLPVMMYLVSHMDYSPKVRLAVDLPITYRTVVAFIDSARKASDQTVVDVIHELSIGTVPSE